MPTPTPEDRPLRVAVANDYELVVAGLAAMLAPFDEIDVVDAVLLGESVADPVDVLLYDPFGRSDAALDGLRGLVEQANVGRVALYVNAADERRMRAAFNAGATAVISKALPAKRLVDALARVSTGEVVIAEAERSASGNGRDWPGRSLGLTERQSEVVALLLEGLTNGQIAEALYVGLDTVKTHLRRAYKVLGVHNRAQAVARLLDDPGFGRFR